MPFSDRENGQSTMPGYLRPTFASSSSTVAPWQKKKKDRASSRRTWTYRVSPAEANNNFDIFRLGSAADLRDDHHGSSASIDSHAERIPMAIRKTLSVLERERPPLDLKQVSPATLKARKRRLDALAAYDTTSLAGGLNENFANFQQRRREEANNRLSGITLYEENTADEACVHVEREKESHLGNEPNSNFTLLSVAPSEVSAQDELVQGMRRELDQLRRTISEIARESAKKSERLASYKDELDEHSHTSQIFNDRDKCMKNVKYLEDKLENGEAKIKDLEAELKSSDLKVSVYTSSNADWEQSYSKLRNEYWECSKTAELQALELDLLRQDQEAERNTYKEREDENKQRYQEVLADLGRMKTELAIAHAQIADLVGKSLPGGRLSNQNVDYCRAVSRLEQSFDKQNAESQAMVPHAQDTYLLNQGMQMNRSDTSVVDGLDLDDTDYEIWSLIQRELGDLYGYNRPSDSISDSTLCGIIEDVSGVGLGGFLKYMADVLLAKRSITAEKDKCRVDETEKK